jgi:hypothetical protein
MLTKMRKRSALLLSLAVVCATLAVVPQTAGAAASKIPAAGTAAIPYVAPSATTTYSACPGSSAAAAGFTDTTSTDVDCIKMFGITTGVTATTYVPAGTISRQDMARFIHRMFVPTGLAAAGTTTVPTFTDTAHVTADGLAAINALASHGITLGTTATTYSPDSNVTREQMALFLNRFATVVKPFNSAVAGLSSNIASAAYNYTDIANSPFESMEAVIRLYNLGVTGETCIATTVATCATTYRPTEDITRAEMASMLNALLAHTNARPAGVSIQGTATPAAAVSLATFISHRNADFTPTLNTLIDEFHDPTQTSVAAALAANARFDGLGQCTASVTTSQGTKCLMDALDLSTNALGNVGGTALTPAAASTTSWWVWTGTQGTAFNTGNAGSYQMEVILAATATPLVYGDKTTYTVSGVNQAAGVGGGAVVANWSAYNLSTPAAADDGVLTAAGASRTITATMSKN